MEAFPKVEELPSPIKHSPVKTDQPSQNWEFVAESSAPTQVTDPIQKQPDPISKPIKLFPSIKIPFIS